MAGRLLLGTSGFAYPEWKGDFYPTDIKPPAMLRFYAERFPSVEINYTFQRHLTERMIAAWQRDTSEDFRFSLKANRGITHMHRLKPGAAAPLREFLTSIALLGDRIGAILFQCAPNFKMDVPLLKDFLAMLPDGRRYAFEFRHESCDTDEVRGVLAERGAAWCVVDDDERDAPLVRTTPEFAYLRLRKTAYDDETLAGWAKDIQEQLADGADVYCYFKHEDAGNAPRFGQTLTAMMEAPSPSGPSLAPGELASASSPPEISEGRERT